VVGTTGELKKMENLVQNQSIGRIVCARSADAPRNSRKDIVGGIMTMW